MTQEDKELLLRDLSARLPYGVICNVKDDKINKVYTLNGVERGGCTFQSRMALYGWNSFVIKPYLRPMSSMTEEEKEKYCLIQDKYIYSSKHPVTGVCELTDYLNSIHIDYRGLIPMGLALEAPEGMYKTE